jgi:hypothetical protein
MAGPILLALSACSTAGVGHGVSPSVSPIGTTPSPATPAPSSPSPTVTEDGPLETGSASVLISGGVALQVGFPTLVEPDVWSLPPGPMDLTWQDPGGQTLRISGTSFASRAATSGDRVLAFTVDGPDGPLEFSSQTGECSITVSPALPTTMGGVFTCSGLTDTTGAVTVSAQGSFSASG